jgi:hypothetical protein
MFPRTRKHAALSAAIASLTLAILACTTLGGPAPEATARLSNEGTPASSVSPTQEEAGPSAELPSPVPTHESNPISLSTEPDDEHSASAVITPEGGTLEAVGADGTAYTLEFPVGAVLSPVEVTMTPNLSADGFPSAAGVQASVHLTPEGLRLVEPATLTISIPDGADAEGLVAFTTYPGGEDLHLVSSHTDGGTIELGVMHFSDPGAAQVTQQEYESLQARYVPTHEEGVARQAVEAASRIESDSARQDGYVDAISKWAASVENRLARAKASDSLVDSALAEYIAWKNLIDRIEIEEPDYDNNTLEELLPDEIQRLQEAAAAAIASAIDRAFQECVQGHDVAQAVRMTRWGMLAERFELWDLGGLEKDRTKDQIDKCVRFKGLFSSTIHTVGATPGVFSGEVYASIPMTLQSFDVTSATVSGTGLLQYRQIDLTGAPGNCQVNGHNGKIEIAAWIGLNIYEGTTGISEEAQVRIIFHERPTEEFLGCAGPSNTGSPLWFANFSVHHQDEMNGAAFVDLIPIEEGNAEFATESYYEVGFIGVEETDISLFHTPGE